MRPYRSLTSLAALAALVALTGCGSDDADSPSGSAPTSSSADESTGTTDETDSPSGDVVDVCTSITVDDVAEIVGAPVTVKEVPGGGCDFQQEDLRAASVSFFTSPYDPGNGGFDGAVAGLTGVLQESSGDEVSGIGDQAFIATGKNPGGSNTQGGGLVLDGGALTQVGVQQGSELSKAEVEALVKAALELAAEKG